MHRMLSAIRSFLQSLLARDCPPDPFAALSLRELADLPPLHPGSDAPCGC